MSHLYDGSDDPETKVIDVFICKIRSKLAAAGAPDIIKTIWGKGYMISSSRDSDPCKSLPFFRVPDPAGKTGC
jgi:two-component system cell cycle response regulator CtrA